MGEERPTEIVEPIEDEHERDDGPSDNSAGCLEICGGKSGDEAHAKQSERSESQSLIQSCVEGHVD